MSKCYSVGPGGSSLKIAPGIWVAIDETRVVDLRGVRVEDIGGRLGLIRGEEPLDANYLVLDLEVGRRGTKSRGRA